MTQRLEMFNDEIIESAVSKLRNCRYVDAFITVLKSGLRSKILNDLAETTQSYN
jgi:hypothetical protein